MSTLPAARRGLAGTLALCALATLALLANHPMPQGHTLADFVRAEAANQLLDGVVHGGFIAILGVLMVCFVLLSGILPTRGSRTAGATAILGLVAFCTGCGTLMLVMILDGFVVPGLAAHFAAATANDLSTGAGLFLICGMMIRFLMPMGLMFQSVAVLSWSAAIVVSGRAGRALAIYGFTVGTLLIAALPTAPAKLTAHLLMAGIVLQSIWYLGLAALLWSAKLPLDHEVRAH